MKFKKWLLKEEYVKSYKKVNPKNPQQYFVVLYGETRPIKDELKKLGFRYFSGTWSTLESNITDEMKKQLETLGVDLSGLESIEPPTSVMPQINPVIDTLDPAKVKADNFLSTIKNDFDKAVKSEGENSKMKNLIANIDRMIENVANSTDLAAKQEFIRNFLSFSSKFRNYSLTNQMLIWAQTKGSAVHVASATNWTALGRSVKDWSNGIMIFAPNFKNVEKDKINSAGDKIKEKVQLKFFKSVKVYDISSTEPIPNHPKVFNPVSRKDWSKDTNEEVEEINLLIKALTKWAEETNIKIDYKDLDSELGGTSSGGQIFINNKFKGINLFSTLAHETAHEILHWLDKNDTGSPRIDKANSKKEKEIDAETTAFIVCNHFGFETKDTPNYLALWQAKGEDIRARRQHISTAVKKIIDGIEKKVEEAGIEFS